MINLNQIILVVHINPSILYQNIDFTAKKKSLCKMDTSISENVTDSDKIRRSNFRWSECVHYTCTCGLSFSNYWWGQRTILFTSYLCHVAWIEVHWEMSSSQIVTFKFQIEGICFIKFDLGLHSKCICFYKHFLLMGFQCQFKENNISITYRKV